MEWCVAIELGGADGTRQTYEVARGGGADPHSTLDPLGLTLDGGKALLTDVQRHLVQARVSEYCAVRRPCRHMRALEDTRTRRLNSLFGTVFATGYDAGTIREAYRGYPHCGKPFQEDTLLAALRHPAA
jgi:hypothetical protein